MKVQLASTLSSLDVLKLNRQEHISKTNLGGLFENGLGYPIIPFNIGNKFYPFYKQVLSFLGLKKQQQKAHVPSGFITDKSQFETKGP